jgi:hypothetical protein
MSLMEMARLLDDIRSQLELNVFGEQMREHTGNRKRKNTVESRTNVDPKKYAPQRSPKLF